MWGEKSKLVFLSPLFCIILISIIELALAENFSKSRNLYGEHGILETPVAGPLSDGTLSFSQASVGAIMQNTISFQALPRVYGALRYTGVGNTSSQSLLMGSGYSYWDRSFDLRVDLLRENKILPDITLGMQDFVGGGSFASEYLVASKSFKDNFRLSAGFGWGTLSSNSVASYGTRVFQDNKAGGNLKYQHLFKGNIGLFGGLQYSTPLDKLKLKLEYSSQSRERLSHWWKNVNKNAPLNYGLDYFLTENISFSAYRAYGEEFGLQINISGNPMDYSGDYLNPVPEPFYSQPLNYENINADLLSDMFNAFKKENIIVVSHLTKNEEIILVIDNKNYTSHSQAFGRSLRILSKYIPKKIRTFTIILSEFDIPITKLSVRRDEVESIIDAPNAEFLTNKLVSIDSAPQFLFDAKQNKSGRKNFNYSILPYYKLHIFDPDRPLYYDIGPRIRLSYKVKPGLIFNFSAVESYYTTFDQIRRGTKGSLPKVRTSSAFYKNEIGPRIETLNAASYFKFSDNIYGRITAGILEDMYSGISTEALYFPSKKPFSIGAEINYVEARHYRQLLKMKELTGLSKLNGHISGYWDTGYYDYLAQLDYGKYLAGDMGSTITLSREFKNGWKAGGFFTLTNAPFKDFGEGSFDKGIFFTVPINPVVPFDTKASFTERIRPLEGDGGARLTVIGRLHDKIKNYSQRQIKGAWPRIWR